MSYVYTKVAIPKQDPTPREPRKACGPRCDFRPLSTVTSQRDFSTCDGVPRTSMDSTAWFQADSMGKYLRYSYTYIYIRTYVRTYVHTYIHTVQLHYITLHYITLHYITLHHITLHYNKYIHAYRNSLCQ